MSRLLIYPSNLQVIILSRKCAKTTSPIMKNLASKTQLTYSIARLSGPTGRARNTGSICVLENNLVTKSVLCY